MWAILLGCPATEIVNFERMGLDGFSLNSLILTREQAFRGKERNNLLVHAYYHTLVHSLVSAFPLIFHSFYYFFFSYFLFFYFLCFSSPFLCSPPFSLVLSLLCTVKALFYIACHDGFSLFCPLIAFVLVQVSFPNHQLVCLLPSHHHLSVLAVPHPIPKQKSFILFSCSPWHFHQDKDGHFLLLFPMACTQ